jgi:hypothetical protein
VADGRVHEVTNFYLTQRRRTYQFIHDEFCALLEDPATNRISKRLDDYLSSNGFRVLRNESLNSDFFATNSTAHLLRLVETFLQDPTRAGQTTTDLSPASQLMSQRFSRQPAWYRHFKSDRHGDNGPALALALVKLRQWRVDNFEKLLKGEGNRIWMRFHQRREARLILDHEIDPNEMAAPAGAYFELE